MNYIAEVKSALISDIAMQSPAGTAVSGKMGLAPVMVDEGQHDLGHYRQFTRTLLAFGG